MLKYMFKLFFLQNDLELFKCGISLLIDCGVAPNIHGEMPHTTYPKGMKYTTTTCLRQDQQCWKTLMYRDCIVTSIRTN